MSFRGEALTATVLDAVHIPPANVPTHFVEQTNHFWP